MSKEKHAFKRLHELPKPTVEEVENRLLAGEPPSSIAHWLQNELGVFKDLQPGSLKKNLERYRAIDLKNKVISDLTKNTKGKTVAGLKRKFLAIDELEELVLIQKGRLEKVLLKEAQLPEGILMKQATDEARLLKETLVELGKMQFEAGVMVRAPKKVSGQVYDPNTGETREFTWTEEQERLFRTLEGIEFHEVVTVQPAGEPAHA